MNATLKKRPLIFLLFLIFACHEPVKETEYLIRICPEPPCDFGARSGYINQRGEIIVPMDRYYYCYTDTIKSFGIVLDHQGTCKAIDKSGNVLYQVFWYDNGPDEISEGLFRIIIDGKIGYADEQGEIIIPPRFKCTTPFGNGKAKVAYNCELVAEGEHSGMQSDAWFYIDKKGNKTE